MLRIMTSSPTVTITNSPNPNQPSIIAVVPTPLRTLPFPRSCATCDAATDAVCCHNTLTRTNIDAMKMSARAACETGREGKGFMSTMSVPERSSSSCQPGKVANRRKVMKAKTMATMLPYALVMVYLNVQSETYIKYGKTTASLNVSATQIRFSGSSSMEA